MISKFIQTDDTKGLLASYKVSWLWAQNKKR